MAISNVSHFHVSVITKHPYSSIRVVHLGTEKSINLVPAASAGSMRCFIFKFLESYEDWFTNFFFVTGSREMIFFIQTCFD